MQDILRYINSVEGVIGSAVFDGKGAVVAHALPALIDADSLKEAAELVLVCVHGLQISLSLDILDLRYAEGRIIIKTFTGARLLLLCTRNINLPVLTITLNLAAKKLSPLLPTVAESPGEAVSAQQNIY